MLAGKDSNPGTQEMLWLEGPGCPLLDPGAISPLTPRREGIRIRRQQVEGRVYLVLLNVLDDAEEGQAREAPPMSLFCSQIAQATDLKSMSDKGSQVAVLQSNLATERVSFLPSSSTTTLSSHPSNIGTSIVPKWVAHA